jgi:hypothetical protein
MEAREALRVREGVAGQDYLAVGSPLWAAVEERTVLHIGGNGGGSRIGDVYTP